MTTDEQIKFCRLFSKGNPTAKQVTTKDFRTAWHPAIGKYLVTLDESKYDVMNHEGKPFGYTKKSDAVIDAAKYQQKAVDILELHDTEHNEGV